MMDINFEDGKRAPEGDEKNEKRWKAIMAKAGE